MPPRSGPTQVAAVLGSPIAHSLSPALHNAAFAALGLDWVFVAFDVDLDHGQEALRGAAALGLRGLSITTPLKDLAAHVCDELSSEAARLGAVNCIVIRHGRLLGFNTDGDGLVDALRMDHRVELRARRAVVLGAGGAARSVIAALGVAEVAEVAVVNRTPSRAEAASLLATGAGRVGSAADIARADIVVNATSVGMGGTGGLPCDPELLRSGQVVVELVVHPVETAWLKAARQHGATAVDGVGMLAHQAARAFRLWTGAEPPVALMLAAARSQLR